MHLWVKFIYSERATIFCETFLLFLTVCTVVKSKGKISQNFKPSQNSIWTLKMYILPTQLLQTQKMGHSIGGCSRWMKPKVRPVCNGYWAKETLKTRENPISVQLNSQLQTRKKKLRNLSNSIHDHTHQIQQLISNFELSRILYPPDYFWQ